MSNGSVLDNEGTSVLDARGEALSTETELIAVDEFGELEITFARPTGFAVGRAIQALEVLGAEIIAATLVDDEDREIVLSTVRLYLEDAHSSLLTIKVTYVVPKEHEPRLRHRSKLKDHIIAGLIGALLADGYAVVKGKWKGELPPPGTCNPAVVEQAGRTLQTAAKEAREITLTTTPKGSEPLQVRVVWPTLGLPERRHRP